MLQDIKRQLFVLNKQLLSKIQSLKFIKTIDNEFIIQLVSIYIYGASSSSGDVATSSSLFSSSLKDSSLIALTLTEEDDSKSSKTFCK